MATSNGNTAAIQQEATTRASADKALGQRIDSVVATSNGNTAAIQQEATTRANADQALTQQVNTALSKANSNTAAIQSEATTRANADSALASQINTVQTQFAGDLASVQQSTQAQYNENTQRLEAMWTLRIDNGGRVSGFGLADDGQESLLGFRADRVYFAHPNSGDEVFPMIVDGGSVLINDALINQLLFTKLRSSDGSLVFQNGELQAEYIAANQISVNWAQIQNAWVTNAQIATAAVDTLKIGDHAVTIPVSTAAGNVVSIGSNESEIEILRASIDAQGANVLVMVSFGAQVWGWYRVEVRRNGRTVIARPGVDGAFSVSAHVGAEPSGESTFTVHLIGRNASVSGRSLGLLATRR